MTFAQARVALERIRSVLQYRLGQAPPPASGEHGDVGDVVTDHAERTLVFASRDQAIARLRSVDEALDRLHAGVWGLCITCQERIAEPRLRAHPEAARCIECQQAHEEQLASAGPESYRVTDPLEREPRRRPRRPEDEDTC